MGMREALTISASVQVGHGLPTAIVKRPGPKHGQYSIRQQKILTFPTSYLHVYPPVSFA